MRKLRFVVLILALVSPALRADEPASRREVEALRAEVAALKEALSDQRQDFHEAMRLIAAKLEWSRESRFGIPIAEDGPKEGGSDLEKEFAEALKGAETSKAPQPVAAVGQLKLIDVSLDILTEAGTSTADEEELARLQGGGHDPSVRGIEVPNVELTLQGVVDPYFRGDAHIIFLIDEEGETVVELEEAYFTTTLLPHGLQVRGGQMFEQFGRLNAQHPHSWDFVDQPVVNTRLLGPDGFRGPTAELSWLTPLPFYAELLGGVVYARGETAVSFLGEEDDEIAGHLRVGREVESLEDLTYLARAKTSFDLSDEWTLVNGVSALFGPNNAGAEGNTQVYGADVYLKWKPLDNDHGFPFVAFQAEAMGRRYETGDGVDADAADLDNEVLNDVGCYAQALYGFHRGWVAGVRYDYADGDGENRDDPLRDSRHRASANLTFLPSEFSKIRLQSNMDEADHIEDEDYSVWIQVEILFGAHGAHKF